MIERLRRILFRSVAKGLAGPQKDTKKIFYLLHESLGTDDILKSFLQFDKELYDLTTLEAGRRGDKHLKHQYLRYADWFCSKIESHENILDVGCGLGELSSQLAQSTKGQVVGIDFDEDKILKCRETHQINNLKFLVGDITTASLSEFEPINVVTLSNVLEHIKERRALLEALHGLKPRRLLVRVPQFDRDWRVPVKRDLGVDYFLDPTHEIEYTFSELEKELKEGGFTVEEFQFNWGEIWAVCQPR